MLRLEYDSIVAHHPYRTTQPWDHGGLRMLHVDGVNGPLEDTVKVRESIQALEKRMAEEWAREEDIKCDRPGAYGRFLDNHYGYTVRIDGTTEWDKATYYQVRFSDGSFYLWLMPGPPESVIKRIVRAL